MVIQHNTGKDQDTWAAEGGILCSWSLMSITAPSLMASKEIIENLCREEVIWLQIELAWALRCRGLPCDGKLHQYGQKQSHQIFCFQIAGEKRQEKRRPPGHGARSTAGQGDCLVPRISLLSLANLKTRFKIQSWRHVIWRRTYEKPQWRKVSESPAGHEVTASCQGLVSCHNLRTHVKIQNWRAVATNVIMHTFRQANWRHAHMKSHSKEKSPRAAQQDEVTASCQGLVSCHLSLFPITHIPAPWLKPVHTHTVHTQSTHTVHTQCAHTHTVHTEYTHNAHRVHLEFTHSAC